METQISFCTVCSMCAFVGGRKAGNWEMVYLICSLLGNLDFASLYSTRWPQRTGLCLGEFRHENTERSSCFIQAFFPWRWRLCHPFVPKHKSRWDFTVSAQNKWMQQKMTPCHCEQKTSSVPTRNRITRNVFLPWKGCACCRGKLVHRSYSLQVPSSLQVKTSSVVKFHSCTQQKHFWPLCLGRRACKGEPHHLKVLHLWTVFFFILKKKNAVWDREVRKSSICWLEDTLTNMLSRTSKAFQGHSPTEGHRVP